MQMCDGMEVKLHQFLISVAGGCDWLASAPAALLPRKEVRYPLDRSLGGPHTGLAVVTKRKPCSGYVKMIDVKEYNLF
jgi:hypothetical protein